ncbi:hypothetical protein BDV93DRAFT_563661 [Ceratobasidium sp. AG-I]|nr:hypothetical protein BDV93DRAFT_563661 [Ceratobasidium sp. AG-I]
MTINSHLHLLKLSQTAETIARIEFDALDTIWCNECPSLSPDSYALLTSAELQITLGTASHLRRALPKQIIARPASPEPLLPSHPSCEEGNSSTQSHLEIAINPMEQSSSNAAVRLFDLRARCSRALSHTAYLLHYHVNGRAHIGADALIHLLGSTCKVAQYGDLNLESHLSTHQPQSKSAPEPCIKVRVIGTGDYRYVEPNMVGDEDCLLVELLGLLASTYVQTNLELEHAAGEALNAIAPVLLQQWLNRTDPVSMEREFDMQIRSEVTLDGWALSTNPLHDGRKINWPASLALGVAAVAVACVECPGIGQLPEKAIFTLYERMKTDPNPWRGCDTAYSQQSLMVEYHKKIVFQHLTLSSDLIPPFLRILAKVPDQVQELQTLLASAETFEALLKIGEHDKYRSIVAKCISGIVQTAANGPHIIQAQTIPAFFDVASFSLKALASDTEGPGGLIVSTRNLLPSRSLLDNIEYPTVVLSATINLRDTLKTHVEKCEEQEKLLVELEGILSWSDIYNSPPGEAAPSSKQNEEYQGESVSQIVTSPARSEASLLLHEFD